MDARGVIRYLHPESDDEAVLSAIFRKTDSDIHLVTASMMIGPKAMVRSSWPQWRHASGVSHASESDDQPEFVHELPGWLVGRAILSIEDATRWVSGAVEGSVPRVRTIPTATAALSPALSPIQVFPEVDSPISQLISGTVRPVRGFFFPDSNGEDPSDLPWTWEVDGQPRPNAPYELLGIFVTDDSPGPVPTPGGLLVGSVERRAWMIEGRGGENLETFDLQIGLDPERIDIADLEIEYEEKLGSEVIMNQRVRLEDVPISRVRGAPQVRVSLPTMGTKVAHAARLRDRDGVLLDMTDSHYLAETIAITLVAGGLENEIVIGEPRPQPSLVERADRTREVIEQYRKWFEEGLDGKVFDDAGEARKALTAHLNGSRGPLTVFDPYFAKPRKDGTAEKDWALVRPLNRASRILTSQKIGPVLPSPRIHHLEVRMWKTTSGRVPFHDRFYLWEGGGLHVGTSPNGFGGRLFRMQRLGAIEADVLNLRFDGWWSSGDVKPLA